MTPEEFQTLFAQYRDLKQTAEAELTKLAKETEQWLPIDIAPKKDKNAPFLMLSGHSEDKKMVWMVLGRWQSGVGAWCENAGTKPLKPQPQWFLPAPAFPDPKSLPY